MIKISTYQATKWLRYQTGDQEVVFVTQISRELKKRIQEDILVKILVNL